MILRSPAGKAEGQLANPSSQLTEHAVRRETQRNMAIVAAKQAKAEAQRLLSPAPDASAFSAMAL